MVRDFEYYLLFQQKIYIQEGSNPETFALGDGFTKLSSVNSCRVKKPNPLGIQTSSHSLPKICWNGWNLASEMLTMCWHPCWERLPREHTTWGHDPTEVFQFATLARSARSCSFHSPAQRKHPWISDPQVPPSAKTHWHRTVIFRRFWSWNHGIISFEGHWVLNIISSNTPIHTHLPQTSDPIWIAISCGQKSAQTLDLMVDPGCTPIEYPWSRRDFCQKWRPFGY